MSKVAEARSPQTASGQLMTIEGPLATTLVLPVDLPGVRRARCDCMWLRCPGIARAC